MGNRARGMMTALLGLTLAAPAGAKAADACRAHGQAALEAWTQGRHDQAGKDFAPAVAAKLTPEMLRQAWELDADGSYRQRQPPTPEAELASHRALIEGTVRT